MKLYHCFQLQAPKSLYFPYLSQSFLRFKHFLPKSKMQQFPQIPTPIYQLHLHHLWNALTIWTKEEEIFDRFCAAYGSIMLGYNPNDTVYLFEKGKSFSFFWLRIYFQIIPFVSVFSNSFDLWILTFTSIQKYNQKSFY